MGILKTFRDLKVWEKGHQLTLNIYKMTKVFPQDEKFGLIAQLRRSSASIPTNIAEGFKRKSKKDQDHFFNIAECSLEETKYHLILSKDLNYLQDSDFESLTDQTEEIGRMLNAYRRSISRNYDTVAACFCLILTSYFLFLGGF